MTDAPDLRETPEAEADLTVDQAKLLSAEIRSGISGVMNAVADVAERIVAFHSGGGWRALGYKNQDECADNEFGITKQRYYQLHKYGLARRRLADDPDFDLDVFDIGETAVRGRNLDAAVQATKEVAKEAKESGASPPPGEKIVLNPVQVQDKATEISNKKRPKTDPPPTDQTGAPLPAFCRRAFENRERLAEAQRALRSIRTVAASVAAQPGGELLEIGNIQHQIDAAALAIKHKMPHALCPKCKGQTGCDDCEHRGWISFEDYKTIKVLS